MHFFFFYQNLKPNKIKKKILVNKKNYEFRYLSNVANLIVTESAELTRRSCVTSQCKLLADI